MMESVTKKNQIILNFPPSALVSVVKKDHNSTFQYRKFEFFTFFTSEFGFKCRFVDFFFNRFTFFFIRPLTFWSCQIQYIHTNNIFIITNTCTFFFSSTQSTILQTNLVSEQRAHIYQCQFNLFINIHIFKC